MAVGVGFQVPNTANLDGYTRELLRQGVTRSSGHFVVLPADEGRIPRAGALVERVAAAGPFVRAVAPRLVHAGVLFRKRDRVPVRIVAVDPAAEQRATGLCDRLAAGACLAADDAEGLLLGATLAERLHVGVGDRLKLVVPYEELGEVEYASRHYPVVGVLRGGGGFQEDKDVWVSQAFLEAILDETDVASAILVFGGDEHENPERASADARTLLAAVGDANVTVVPWHEASTFVANAIAGNRTITAISLLMVIIAVVIPVLALLSIHVLHDRRQIAITAAVGFSRGAIFLIYLMKAAIIGLLGVGLGAALGLGLCAWFDAHPIFDNDGFVVRPLVTARAILVPAAVLLAATLVAGLAPAWRAARSNPAVELREE